MSDPWHAASDPYVTVTITFHSVSERFVSASERFVAVSERFPKISPRHCEVACIEHRRDKAISSFQRIISNFHRFTKPIKQNFTYVYNTLPSNLKPPFLVCALQYATLARNDDIPKNLTGYKYIYD